MKYFQEKFYGKYQRGVKLPDLSELLHELQLDCLQKLSNGVAFPDHHLPTMPCSVPVAVGDLKRLILHYLSASQQGKSNAFPLYRTVSNYCHGIR